MIKYVCKNCNYRFSSENPKKCPYCDKGLIEKEKTASEFLEEIERLLK